jgi:hypothetical protein
MKGGRVRGVETEERGHSRRGRIRWGQVGGVDAERAESGDRSRGGGVVGGE